MTTAFFLLVVTSISIYILWPILGDSEEVHSQAEPDSLTSREDLIELKDASIAAIVDLQFDHEMGKLDHEDFTNLSHQYRSQAKSALEDLDKLDK